ncbi:hypothetical protein StScam27_09075 [Streptococcus thermophilus]|uniref:Trigger factor C-terminal domain-containing protein n=2 Tax=Streptococcaceae TaxID=1300 RepID=A0ABR5EJ22_LACLC|nr:MULTISPECIES: hypothetical protein [Streptococcaceae]KKW74514.1 hypothetical protein VN93_0557 [Lactococcus cremoris]KKW74647.1 hypothetical protein VN93_0393 [Lactococcus cremoris]MBW7800450.1 hypothetical protein [Streptococcus thermophilus]MBW7818375.1 hypothetical protein [Streptococcus thermophilus]MCE2168509.1 hypothetical protein [Streptococcus thermophilus]
MEKEKLNLIIKKNEEFKNNTDLTIKKDIDYELSNFRKILPKKFLTKELDIEIKNEVDKKVSEFSEDIDLNPEGLYSLLKKSEVESNGEISETELTNLAYDYLEKNTKNKFFKKILKELKKENE